MTSKNADSFPAAVDRVAVRIPPFCPSDPEMWFCMVERSFKSANVVSDDTKFGYVLGALDPIYATEVRDIIVKPPESGAYAKLKQELIRRLSSSQEQKTRRLLEHEEIGDRRPSQFLRHLQSLAGTSVPDSIIRTLWLGRLPQYMQTVLATQKDATLDKVAEVADAMTESIPNRSTISEARHPNTVEDMNIQFQQMFSKMREEIKNMVQQEISAVTEPFRSRRDHTPNRSRLRRSSHSRNRSGQNNVCWYHWRFGKESRKCSAPCSFTPGNDQSGR